MTAINCGDLQSSGPTTPLQELHIAQEQPANPEPLSFTARFWRGTRGS